MPRMASILTRIPKAIPATVVTPGCTAYPVRYFSQSARMPHPTKNSQDRESINTESTEYSKSSTDDSAAGQDKAAFDPKVTKPETAKNVAGEGNGKSGNPLEFSPANRDLSKPVGEHDGKTKDGKKSSSYNKRS